MEPNRQRSWRQGFTLVETLVVVAIAVILLAVSAVGVVYYARWLKITELDNAAREIYMAAENRAVLLSGSSRLEKLVTGRGKSVTVKLAGTPDSEEPATVYYIYHRSGSEVADLLPVGTIDPALMEGSFYIVYEPESGSVTDVFYAEEGFGPEDEDGFQVFYDEVSTSPRSWRMRMKPMVGYYGGGTAENAKDDALGVPIVTIRNEETLTAEITYAVFPSMADETTLKVTLTYGDISIPLNTGDFVREEKDGRVRFTYTILLDSLENGKHFYDLFQFEPSDPSSFGGDFTVTATLTAEGATPSSGSDTDNSLFAEGSGGDTAYIANLRHLQNLDKATSKVGGKTQAEQKNDIDCSTYLEEEYTFTPIQNDALKSYDGAENIIRNLNAVADGNAGLFASAEDMTFQKIRLVNSSVEGKNNVGALVGSAKNTIFNNCWVYWEPETGTAGLRDVLGVGNETENDYHYQITGNSAGGLVGQLEGGTLTDCLAATLVDGTTVAGGLIGQATETVSITGSYADCYLTGKTAGGLAGTAENLNLQNCYAAGFIEISGGSAAGLCTSENVTGNTVYSVMRCSSADWEPLAPNMSGTNYYYLASEASDTNDGAKTYKEMTEKGFAETLGGAFGWKDQDSHPYNLRTDLALTVYDFPGLTNLPHYGDWNAQFVEASLVYYEQYEGNQYGFYGGGVDALQNRQPVMDGYAIAIRQEGTEQVPQSLTVTYGGTEYPCSTENAPTVTLNETTFLLAPLPDELVNTNVVSEKFYQSLSFTIGDETHNYYYCPHFAKTAVKTDEMPPAPTGVSVRTPRHLYMLSLYPAYYNYTFHQELDLDYAVYTGYNLFPAGFTQVPIGRFDEPFNGYYDGGCHTIEHLVFKPLANTTRAYAGLFGYSTGTLRDIVYLMDADKQNAVSLGNHNDLYIGGLAGGNAGSIVNCAAAGVNLMGSAYTATIYIGGLVGRNEGEITNCGAECAALAADTSSYAKAYAGGLVGQNWSSGIISSSYAVGRASAEVDATSEARVCGFVGYNFGLVWNSYAAMDLASSGKNVETYGFCGVTDGTQNGTYFLNRGNFTYRDVSYNASYTPRKAAQIDYAGLTDRTASPVAGMAFVGGDKFPYPTAVRDAAGQPVHYGQWPEPMQLGVMGVYYWEQLEIGDETPTYHVSLLAADLDKQTITKQTTLSTAHSDNGVVTGYGYGYYAQNDKDSSVTLAATDISYSLTGEVGSSFPTQNAEENTDANKILAELMPGYTFHSYHSFGMEEDGGGLYPTGSPNGTFKLTQGSTPPVDFAVNPHFADALSVITLPQGWTLAGGASKDAPGSTANPYEVRAVSQLQNINWNRVSCNNNTILRLDGKENGDVSNFPYLSHSNASGKYFWAQTHDMNGRDKSQSPIAEYYDTQNSADGLAELKGWFGGTYNGNDYVIENVSVQGGTSSCAGLFGVVYNGTLENIILYSSSGKSKVCSTYDENTQSQWYGIGALAGLAASSGTESAVKNCAVSGYTIEAKTCTAYVLSGKELKTWGGTGVGGLVGMSNMQLTGCTAVTDIVLSGESIAYDNLRVGGLVGTCQQSITDCYAGGSITVETGIKLAQDMKSESKFNGYTLYDTYIYIGGIVGGSYMRPLAVMDGTAKIGQIGFQNDAEGLTSNALYNCYSYVKLPAKTDKIDKLYALGGTGEIVESGGNKANHGTCIRDNCYYLSNGGTTGTDDVTGVTALTYAELAGEEIYNKLTAFSPVTSQTDDGFSISGKYSYPSEQYLQGLNYPFPTILTRENSYHVHYGDWPLNGIKRENGGAPIELDLFTAATHTETLELEGVSSGGVWSAVAAPVNTGETDENGNPVTKEIVTAKCENGELTVTGTGVGVTTVTVTYAVGGVSYTLPLSVNVTAELNLGTADSPVRLFTNDTAGVELMTYGKSKDQDLSDLGVTVKPAVGVYDSLLLKTAKVGGNLVLELATGDMEGNTTVNINYTYTYNGVDYTGMSAITFQITKPEITMDGKGTYFVKFEDGEINSATVTSGNLDEEKLSFDKGTVSLDMQDVSLGTAVTVEVVVTVDGREHVVTVTVTAEEADAGLEDGGN